MKKQTENDTSGILSKAERSLSGLFHLKSDTSQAFDLFSGKGNHGLKLPHFDVQI